jgi:putative RNA 2'-phosphotransferase
VDLEALAAGLATQPGWESLAPADLRALAEADPRRYEVCGGRIRARYGHTVSVDEPGELALPPEWLYVGIDPSDLASVRGRGLRPTSRQRVHLATTPQAALDVGRRHAPEAAVVVVLARRAAGTGTVFRRAGPTLFLTDGVPAQFLLLPVPDCLRGASRGTEP